MCDTHSFFLSPGQCDGGVFFCFETALVCCVGLYILFLYTYTQYTKYPLRLFSISFVFAKIRIYEVVHTRTRIYMPCIYCVLLARIGSCGLVCLCLCVLAHFQWFWCSRITIVYIVLWWTNVLLEFPGNLCDIFNIWTSLCIVSSLS